MGSYANNLWQFYGLALINGIFLNAVNFMIIGILISFWYEDKRGFAFGPAWAALLVFSIIITICLVAAEMTYRREIARYNAIEE